MYKMIHSFLLIGQSNMAGRGFLNEAVEVDSSKIKILRNGRWQPMFRPINPDRSFSGVSLAESFAEKYAKEHGVEVGLICCADGGTGLDQWEEGSLLFDNAVFNAKLASRTSTIAGVLWHQGETDCLEDRFPLYEQKFIQIMEALRRELKLSDVPFVLGGLGDYLTQNKADASLKNYFHVNEALKRIAASCPMTGFVSAEGLTSNPDYLHFNAKSLYEFGLRYFDVFEALRDENKVFKEKYDFDDTKRNKMELL